MHRESIYVCTWAQGSERVVGRVRAWDKREAAQLFAVELEWEGEGRRVGAQDVTVRASPTASPRRRASPTARR